MSFKKSFDEMLGLEFGSPYNALHKNKGEGGYTFMGIYEGAHPSWSGWEIVYRTLELYKDLRKASYECYQNVFLTDLVKEFYKLNFWDRLRLDEIKSDRIADLIFKFAVNVGIKRAVRYAQMIVNVKLDSIIGNNTISALNTLDSKYFEERYKTEFIKFYEGLAKRNPNKYNVFLKGWLNRIKRS
ncbi:putative peptidoglycan-binding domain-containing protein [Campylobacter ureolyticus]|uniref:Peptidoglycan binding domain-containing protein n=1 Tax=Campylobacter ureolyticus TaxID=827 RepID=A0AAE7EAF5_9BACT|nr:putative peptidoglycan-binding domain-containing protein [Campylobacter ureolyticus]MCR8685207.1 peptidoglycan domain protein [Campylobacter ureolyticus]QKF84545.1 peptidoglycan binding domain-containing protein [Campylobacter ureolyticus]QQY35294.1 peptidoglycan domain protein [Campylobacter ureolyticus]SUX22257.1 Predicted Peptidoglycan domain [Campylobacter ureolyticus]